MIVLLNVPYQKYGSPVQTSYLGSSARLIGLKESLVEKTWWMAYFKAKLRIMPHTAFSIHDERKTRHEEVVSSLSFILLLHNMKKVVSQSSIFVQSKLLNFELLSHSVEIVTHFLFRFYMESISTNVYCQKQWFLSRVLFVQLF